MSNLREIPCGMRPNESVVSLLERLLAEAKTGDLQAVAVAGSYRSGELVRARAGECNNLTMCGVLDLIKLQMLDEVLDGG